MKNSLNNLLYIINIDRFESKINIMETPCYVYDLKLLENTLTELNNSTKEHNYMIHYAIKANTDVRINKMIANKGLGADCVSGNEIIHALKCGYRPEKIVFAGVGKTDKDIIIGLRSEIGCFNIESSQEIDVINSLAIQMGKKARIAIRVNPDVNAETHEYITTGLNENKFGVSYLNLMKIIEQIEGLSNVELTGLHFHIGSQITNMDNFMDLCNKVNIILDELRDEGIYIKHLNMGGGLGIDYNDPDNHLIADFEQYFNIFKYHLNLEDFQILHFELGRSIVGQCGSLVTKVLYIKNGVERNFAIVDAGMTDLLRPALYKAQHCIQQYNDQVVENKCIYDVVGPICESSDVFGKNIHLPALKRGDRLVIRSVGAYGEVMSNNYNLRDQPFKYYIDPCNGVEAMDKIKLAFPTYYSLKKTLEDDIILQ